MKTSVLILGKPDSGKSAFKHQLSIRLYEEQGAKFYKTPDDNTDLTAGNGLLYRGLDISRTSKDVNKTTILPIEFPDGKQVDVAYPEAAGEQINDILKTRQIPEVWFKNIKKSDNWILFIRADQIKETKNFLNVSYVDDKTPEKDELNAPEKNKIREFEIADDAYYIELLQMLLYIKKLGTLNVIKDVKLTIVLSCWDKLKKKKIVPADLLQEKLPLLLNFISTIWDKSSITILGLSALQQDLDTKTVNEDFMDKGPENNGYVIQENGKKTTNLTEVISYVT